jgi:hypothetical protein
VHHVHGAVADHQALPEQAYWQWVNAGQEATQGILNIQNSQKVTLDAAT